MSKKASREKRSSCRGNEQPEPPGTSIERVRRRSRAWRIFTCSVQTHKSWFATVAAAAGGRVVPISSSRLSPEVGRVWQRKSLTGQFPFGSPRKNARSCVVSRKFVNYYRCDRRIIIIREFRYALRHDVLRTTRVLDECFLPAVVTRVILVVRVRSLAAPGSAWRDAHASSGRGYAVYWSKLAPIWT